MAETLLHIRRSYQIEGEKRWSYWSAVLVTGDGQRIIASTEPRVVPSATYPRNLSPLSSEDPMPVARFEYDNHVRREGKALAERMQAAGWEPVERDAYGQVVRMQRKV